MLNNLLSGEFLALGGAALASLFAGIGSAKGVGIAGEAAAGAADVGHGGKKQVSD